LNGTAGVPKMTGITLRRPGFDHQPEPGSLQHRRGHRLPPSAQCGYLMA
jgi:hypothetical protein